MAKNVKIYSTPACPYCMRAKQFLKDSGIEFQDIDVSSDPAMAEEMTERSGQMGVPVLDIAGQIIVGYDKGAIKEALNI